MDSFFGYLAGSRVVLTTEHSNWFSYAIGCMMGRYSLDASGLIYAHSGNEGFDPSRYNALPADADGIVPVTEIDWFEDGAVRRFEEFVAVAWPAAGIRWTLSCIRFDQISISSSLPLSSWPFSRPSSLLLSALPFPHTSMSLKQNHSSRASSVSPTTVNSDWGSCDFSIRMASPQNIFSAVSAR